MPCSTPWSPMVRSTGSASEPRSIWRPAPTTSPSASSRRHQPNLSITPCGNWRTACYESCSWNSASGDQDEERLSYPVGPAVGRHDHCVDGFQVAGSLGRQRGARPLGQRPFNRLDRRRDVEVEDADWLSRNYLARRLVSGGGADRLTRSVNVNQGFQLRRR